MLHVLLSAYLYYPLRSLFFFFDFVDLASIRGDLRGYRKYCNHSSILLLVRSGKTSSIIRVIFVYIRRPFHRHLISISEVYSTIILTMQDFLQAQTLVPFRRQLLSSYFLVTRDDFRYQDSLDGFYILPLFRPFKISSMLRVIFV